MSATGQHPNQDICVRDSTPDRSSQGQLVEVVINDLNDDGEGVGRIQGGLLVVFVPDTVPGDRALVRLVRVKPRYAYGKVYKLLEASEHRIRPNCIVADKCGGCQWQHISYKYQLTAKRQQVIQALTHIGGFSHPSVDLILPAPNALGYRNKATYPIGTSTTGQVQAGYYQKGSHHLVNLNQCPVQDSRLNPLLKEVKQDIQDLGWPVYNERHHQGLVRHLALRIGRRTGEMLLTLVSRNENLRGLEAQAQKWLNRYPELVGVCLNHNPERTNSIFGAKTRCIAGQSYLLEQFAGLQIQIRADTFFQVYTEAAEALLQVIIQQLNLQGQEVLVDAYCGVGTLTLPLAQKVGSCLGLEVQPEAVEQARLNAALNGITNATFQVGPVETLLPQLTLTPDIVLLDPPRKGCERRVIESLLHSLPRHIVYVSCKPATLARDLKLLCQLGTYKLIRVQPVDFFPQTAHVECAAFLSLKPPEKQLFDISCH